MPITGAVDIESRGGWTIDGGPTRTVELRVDTDDKTIGAAAVMAYLNLTPGASYRFPIVADATETDAFSFLTSVDVSPSTADKKSWRCVLTYSWRNPAADPRGPIEDGSRNPFNAPPIVRARGEDVEHEAMFDRDGVAVKNTAGDPMPGVTFYTSDLVIAISRFEPSYPFAAMQAYRNRLNDDVWLGFPAESVLCRDITASREWNPDVFAFVWTVEYEFVYREPLVVSSKTIISGWAEKYLNAGLRELVGGNRKAILVDNAPISEPVQLKSDGTKAAPGDDPYFLTFNFRPAVDFSALGFDSSLLS